MMYFYPNDRRKNMRIIIDYSVICYVECTSRGIPLEGVEAFSAKTADISEQGVSLITKNNISPGTKVRIKFIMSSKIANDRFSNLTNSDISIKGIICYSLPLGEHQYRIGIQYDEADGEDLEDKFFRLLCTQY